MTNKLNINNSQSYFNLTLKDRDEDDGSITVTPENAESVRYELKQVDEENDILNPRNETSYLYVVGVSPDDNELLSLLFKRGGYLTYVSNTNNSIPLFVIEEEALYRYTSHVELELTGAVSHHVAEDIRRASAANRISLTINADNWSSYNLIVSLDKLRYIIDSVTFYTESKTPEEYYQYFIELRDALSAWKMLIIFNYSSKEEYDYLLERAEVDKGQLKSRVVW